jgi:N-acetylneuraminic acid mutarotase
VVTGGASGDLDSPAFSDAIEAATFDADGALGEFGSVGTLAQPRANHGFVAHGGYVYLVGGRNSSGPLTDVSFATVDGQGAPGSFAGTTPLPEPRYAHATLLHQGRLYVLGGVGADLRNTNTVWFASFNSDGTLGEWTGTTVMSVVRSSLGVASVDDTIYVVGGRKDADASGSGSNEVRMAQTNADGTIDVWIKPANVSRSFSEHMTLVVGGRIYIWGGDGYGRPGNEVFYYDLAAKSWNSGQGIDAARAGAVAFVRDRFVYFVAGRDGDQHALGDIARADIEADDAVVGWKSGIPYDAPWSCTCTAADGTTSSCSVPYSAFADGAAESACDAPASCCPEF